MDGYTVEVAATTVNRPPNGSASSTLAPSTMKKVNHIKEPKKDKNKARVPIWTIALMSAGVISKESVIETVKKSM